jgi:hypothetical protein
MAGTTRDTELGKRPAIKTKALKLYQDVEKGFDDQRKRSDDILDYWDAYNLKLTDRQFYNGNSRIYLPFMRDAIGARSTRFTNQLFPQSQRFVEVVTENGDVPHATMSLLEHYVRWNRLRTRVVKPLIVNGDIEGQYTLYVGWRQFKRYIGHKVQQPVMVDGLEYPELGDTPDFEEEKIKEAGPWAEVISDADLLVLPVTADTIDDAIESGGSVTIMRRWSKAAIKQMVSEGEIIQDAADSITTEMDRQQGAGTKPDVAKKIADAAGIKGAGKHVLGYETWTKLKVDGSYRLCRIYYGSDKIILGVKLCPYWCDRVPVLSGPVEKATGVFKGRAPAADVIDLQILANDTINEGADTAHFSAMPIIMTDPEKNPRTNNMILGLGAIWETSPNDTKFAQFPELWRSAFDRASELKQQMFQTLSVNPSMLPGSKGKQKQNQAEIANEQQVDLLTTADAVTVLEEEILSPLLQRFADYDHQFRDEGLMIRTFGPIGQKAAMENIEPEQSDKRYSFRWFGVEAARNAAQMQQQIAGINVMKEIPPQLYGGFRLDLSPMLVQMAENLFGPRLAPLIFKPLTDPSVDPMTENDMMEHGFVVNVHPSDNDQEHMQAHIQVMQASGDPHGTFRKHLMEHQVQMMSKAQDVQKQQQGGGPPQQGSGGGNGGQAPASGAQPGMPSNMKMPPGAIPQDSMAKAGAPVAPRK